MRNNQDGLHADKKKSFLPTATTTFVSRRERLTPYQELRILTICGELTLTDEEAFRTHAIDLCSLLPLPPVPAPSPENLLLQRQAETLPLVLLDLREVTFIDSACIGTIVKINRSSPDNYTFGVIVETGSQLEYEFRLLRLDTRFLVLSTQAEASIPDLLRTYWLR